MFEFAAAGAGGAADAGAPMFEFVLTQAGDALDVRGVDVALVRQIARSTHLDAMLPDTVHAAFAAQADAQGAIDKRGFDRAVRQLIPGEMLSEQEKTFLSMTLSNIFCAYDRE